MSSEPLKVEVQEGVLVFKTADDFYKTISEIGTYSDYEREQWEESIGFLSQRRIITQIIKAEQKHIEPYMNMTDEEVLKLSEVPNEHSDLFYKYLNSGLIKITDEGTDQENWDFTVFNKTYVDFLNEDGFFAVGDTIFQATSNSIKIVPSGIFSDLEQIKTTEESNDKIHILSNTLKSTRYYYDSDVAQSGKKRISIEVYGDQIWFIPSSKIVEFTYVFFVRCQEKKLFSWKDINTETWISGKWDLGIDTWTSFSNSFYYHYNMCYLKQSMNPETGVRSNDGTHYTVKLPYWENYDPVPTCAFTNIYWYALRYGGASGLKAEVGTPY
jgi:hypothetical protein